MAAATATKTHSRQHPAAVEKTSLSSSSSIPPPPLLPALSSFESVRRRLAYKDDVDDDDATSVCTTNGTEVDFYSGSDEDSTDEENKSSTNYVTDSQNKMFSSANNVNAGKSDITPEDDDDDEDLYDVDGTCSVGVLFNAKTSSVLPASDSNCRSILDVNQNEPKATKSFNGDARRVKTPTNDISKQTSSGCQPSRSSQQCQSKRRHQKQQIPPCEPEFLWAHHVQTVFTSPPPSLPPLFPNGQKSPHSTDSDHLRQYISFVGDEDDKFDQGLQLSNMLKPNNSNGDDRASSAPVILPPHQQKPSSQLPTTTKTTAARRKLIISKTFVAPSSSATEEGNDMSLPALAAARAALLQQQNQQTFPPSSASNKNQTSSFHRFYMLTPQSSESGGSFNTTPTSLVTTTTSAMTTTIDSQNAPASANGGVGAVENHHRNSTISSSSYVKPFTIMSPVEHPQPQTPLSSSSPTTAAFHDFATFDAYDMRLQQHVRFAIEQVREAAKLQVLQERNARRQTAFMRPRLAQYLPAGKYRFDRTLLSSLCAPAGTSFLAHQQQRSGGAPHVLSHLQIIVQELYDAIEKRNDELVQLLVLRDELSMEQDSILVDLQDLQRRVREKMLSKSTARVRNAPPPSKAHLPKSCSLTFAQQQPAQHQGSSDRISSFAQRLFAKGLGRRTSFGASGRNTPPDSNSAYSAVPVPPTSPPSSTTAAVPASPLAMLGQRFFSLINFSNSNTSQVDKSKYQPISLSFIDHSISSSSSAPTATPSERGDETTSGSGRENGDRGVSDDDDDDDDDYYYDEG